MARFLFVDPNLEYLARDEPRSVGGAAVQAFNWMRGLLAIGEEVACLTRSATTLPGLSGLTVIPGYHARGGIGYLTVQAPYLGGVMRDYRPDFVYQAAAGVITGLLAGLVPRFGARFLHRIANDADLDERRTRRLSPAKRAIYDFGLRHAAGVLCQNEYQLEKLRAFRPDGHNAVLVNPIWLGEQSVRPGEAREYVAWLGILQAQKNIAGLLEVAQALPDVPFVIAGRLADKADALTRAHAEQLRALPNVRFIGYLTRAEVPAFLARAYALVNTSHYEGFPNTYVEAWAAGTPVVAARSADPDQRIENFGLGAVADTPAQLAAALRGIIQELPTGVLPQKCRDYVREHHDAICLAARCKSWLTREFPETH